MTRHRRQIEEDSPLAYAGPHEWMREARNLAAIGLVGIAAVGSVGVYAYETTKGSHPKKEAEPAPDSPYPNTTFMSNFNLSVLPYVTDKAGPLPDTSFNFGSLRADEVDSSAICHTPDNKYVGEPVKTIVIYKSDAPKEGFKQVWPSLGEQTALAHVTLYSHVFPNKFKDGIEIGKSKAARLAREVKQAHCVEEGAFVGYKDQHIQPVIPESYDLYGSPFSGGNIDITPKNVAGAALLLFVIGEAGLMIGSGSRDKETSEMCMNALSAQIKFIPNQLAKFGGRDGQGDDHPEIDEEVISWPADSPELMPAEIKPEPHQEWGI